MLALTPKPKKTTYVTLAVTPEMKLVLKQAAKRHGLTMSEFLRQLAENFLSSDFNFVENIQQSKDKVTTP